MLRLDGAQPSTSRMGEGRSSCTQIIDSRHAVGRARRRYAVSPRRRRYTRSLRIGRHASCKRDGRTEVKTDPTVLHHFRVVLRRFAASGAGGFDEVLPRPDSCSSRRCSPSRSMRHRHAEEDQGQRHHRARHAVVGRARLRWATASTWAFPTTGWPSASRRTSRLAQDARLRRGTSQCVAEYIPLCAERHCRPGADRRRTTPRARRTSRSR